MYRNYLRLRCFFPLSFSLLAPFTCRTSTICVCVYSRKPNMKRKRKRNINSKDHQPNESKKEKKERKRKENMIKATNGLTLLHLWMWIIIWMFSPWAHFDTEYLMEQLLFSARCSLHRVVFIRTRTHPQLHNLRLCLI